MTNLEKIKFFQLTIGNALTASDCLKVLHNINSDSNSILDKESFELLTEARTRVDKLNRRVINDFVAENFSDSSSDCATVQISQPVSPVTKRGFSVPVFLVKGDETHPFDSYGEAGRFLADKFGGRPYNSAQAISDFFRLGKQSYHLHGYTPVKKF